MMDSTGGKQYGLIIAKKKQQNVVTSKPSIFGNESDSDNEENIEKVIKKESLKKLSRKQTQLEMQRALTEDPTVYEYDSIYDDLKEQKETKKSQATSDRKPKYIEALLKTAEKRKKDYERRVERKIQVEREEEGEKFADKEAFVTSAYKKKMQELQEEEEKEKRMDVIEEMMDVTKQKDLSGFYRHLLKRQTDGTEGASVSSNIQVKEEPTSDNEVPNDQKKQDRKHPPDSLKEKASSSHSTKDSNPTTLEGPSSSTTESKAREALSTLRKTSSNKDTGVLNSNADADSDFSIDSESSSTDSSDEEQIEVNSQLSNKASQPSVRKRKNSSSPGSSPDSRRKRSSEEPELEKSSANGDENVKEPVNKTIKETFSALDEDSKSDDSEAEPKEPVLTTEMKWKLLFTKRTVGTVFEAARERYLRRKEASVAARLAFASVPVK